MKERTVKSPKGRFDFKKFNLRPLKIEKDKIDFSFSGQLADKYEPTEVDGELAFKDKFTGDVYPSSVIKDLIKDALQSRCLQSLHNR